MKEWFHISVGLVLATLSGMACADDSYKLCKSMGNGVNCEARSSVLYGEPPKGSVIYSKDFVRLIPQKGTARQYEVADRYECERCENHVVKYDQAHAFFWVYGEGYESGFTELVSYKSGESYKFIENEVVVNIIDVSPDGDWLLVDQNDESHRSLTIYRYSKDKLEKLQSFDTKDFAKIKSGKADEGWNAIWINSDEIGLLNWNREKWKYDAILARIVKTNQRWELRHD